MTNIEALVDALEAEALLSGEHRDERHVRRRLAARASLLAAVGELQKERDGLKREKWLREGNHHPGYIIGDHWMTWAYWRICAGESEESVMEDFGYTYTDKARGV